MTWPRHRWSSEADVADSTALALVFAVPAHCRHEPRTRRAGCLVPRLAPGALGPRPVGDTPTGSTPVWVVPTATVDTNAVSTVRAVLERHWSLSAGPPPPTPRTSGRPAANRHGRRPCLGHITRRSCPGTVALAVPRSGRVRPRAGLWPAPTTPAGTLRHQWVRQQAVSAAASVAEVSRPDASAAADVGLGAAKGL